MSETSSILNVLPRMLYFTFFLGYLKIWNLARVKDLTNSWTLMIQFFCIVQNHWMMQISFQGHHKFPPKYAIKKTNQIASAFHSFSTIFSYTWAGTTSMYSMKSMFWTNEKLSLIVAWSSSVSISRFKVQSSIGHLVWFFDSGNSLVPGANLWCPWQTEIAVAVNAASRLSLSIQILTIQQNVGTICNAMASNQF